MGTKVYNKIPSYIKEMDNYKAFNTLLTGWPFNFIPLVPRCFKCFRCSIFDTFDYAPEPQTAETAYR
jgi:hypothetical protein